MDSIGIQAVGAGNARMPRFDTYGIHTPAGTRVPNAHHHHYPCHTRKGVRVPELIYLTKRAGEIA